MRIGFIGNVAGGMYTFARCFRALGYEAYYLHLPSSHAFTDPAWEDGNAFVPYRELQHQRTLRRLRRTWVKPHWVLERPLPKLIARTLKLGDALLRGHIKPHQLADSRFVYEFFGYHYPFFQRDLRACDWIMASGVMALLACYHAGVPYVFWPSGGDLRDAAGHRGWVRHDEMIKILRHAVHCAVLAGSHGSAMNQLLCELCPPERVTAIPFLLDTVRYHPQEVIPDFPFLPSEVNALLRERARLVLFMPSRMSDRWKGTGMFLSAFLEVVQRYPDRLFLIAAGWGDDYPTYRDRLMGNDVARQSVYVMDGAISKGYLRQLLNCVDVVVDQFVLGWYGAAFVEAAGMGKMVMANLDRDAWRSYVQDMAYPPVRECRTREEIVGVLADLARGAIDPRREGEAMLAWARENHGMERWVPRIVALVGAALRTTKPAAYPRRS